MGCILSCNKVHPSLDIPGISSEITPDYISSRRPTTILVCDDTLNTLDDIRELRRGTYDIIVPKKMVRFQGVPVDVIMNQLEQPDTKEVAYLG